MGEEQGPCWSLPKTQQAPASASWTFPSWIFPSRGISRLHFPTLYLASLGGRGDAASRKLGVGGSQGPVGRASRDTSSKDGCSSSEMLLLPDTLSFSL